MLRSASVTKAIAWALGAGLIALAIAPAAPAKVSDSEARKWRPDLRRAHHYADARSGNVGLAVVDMKGRLREAHGRKQVPMASTFKVMLLVAYLRHEARHRDLTGAERDLLTPMIRVSDSNAATRIRDTLGVAPILRLADRAGMRDFTYNAIWGLSTSTAVDQARFMRRLRELTPRRHWRFARHQLASIVPSQRWGIGRVDLPHGWWLRFKGGWGSGSGAVDHQVVLLQNGGRRIGLAVMTSGNPDHEYAITTLRGVFARLLHDLPR